MKDWDTWSKEHEFLSLKPGTWLVIVMVLGVFLFAGYADIKKEQYRSQKIAMEKEMAEPSPLVESNDLPQRLDPDLAFAVNMAMRDLTQLNNLVVRYKRFRCISSFGAIASDCLARQE